MTGKTCKVALVGLLAILTIGCDKPAEPILLKTEGVAPAVDYSGLDSVLEKVVTKDSLLILQPLEEHSGRLDQQLKLLAVTGPTVTPQLFSSEEDKIAYWYNARAAWALKLASVGKLSRGKKECKLADRAFSLDGRMLSLAEIDRILETFGDWRVVVASPGVTFRRCRLPDRAFSGKDVRASIAARLNGFVDDNRWLVIDTERKCIYIPPILWRFRQELIDGYNRRGGTSGANFITALLPHVTGSAHRRLQDAIGYRCAEAKESFLLALLEED